MIRENIFDAIMKHIGDWKPEKNLTYHCTNLADQKDGYPRYMIHFDWPLFWVRARLCEIHGCCNNGDHKYRHLDLEFTYEQACEMLQAREDILAEMKDDRLEDAYSDLTEEL